jgi:hypothetical protein
MQKLDTLVLNSPPIASYRGVRTADAEALARQAEDSVMVRCAGKLQQEMQATP